MKLKEKLLEDPTSLENLEVEIVIEIASKKIPIQDLLELKTGSAIVFEQKLDSPLNILIKDKKIAEGRLVRLKDRYGIKITEVFDEIDRLL